MTTAIVLIRAAPGAATHVADAVAELPWCREVYSVSGRYDVVAVLRLRSVEDLPGVVADRIDALSGVLTSETLLAFRATSRTDMERMFSIGAESPEGSRP